MAARRPCDLPPEPTKPKVDVTLGGVQYSDGKYVCMKCFHKPDFYAKSLSLPIFRNELTGKETCSLCSKSLKSALILDVE